MTNAGPDLGSDSAMITDAGCPLQPSPPGGEGVCARLFRKCGNSTSEGVKSRSYSVLKWAGLAVLASVAICALALEIGVRRLGPLPLARAQTASVTVLDRNDLLLRAYTTEDERWRLPVETSEVDPLYLRMLIAVEDRRFYSHVGVDPGATARAIGQLIRHGRIVSGSSTLTMQVARLLDGVHERDASGKVRQMLRALQIERQFSKADILKLYLKLAPFGGNLEGVRAASLAYFGTEPKHLSPAQAALLVALPQAPESRKPDRFPDVARRARDRVLARAMTAGVINAADAIMARDEAVPRVRHEFAKFAAHLADAEKAADPDRLVHRLTLDLKAQMALEALAREHARSLGAGLSDAVIAVEHGTGEIVAEVGSAGFLDATRSGAVDMAHAVRSPGSTLKPLIYGMAFEAGLAHPDTLIDDRPTRFGTYVPKNFDRDWHGTVTIREALAQSLNIPAVSVLEAIGPGKFYGRILQAGLEPQLPNDSEPTLAVALGGLGLRLSDLAQLYAGLARGGDAIALRHRQLDAPPTLTPRTRLLNPVAAWYVSDILRHAPAPANAKTGQIAFKTGTSYGTRDAWAIGFDGRHTVAVWVGRADGASVPGLAGRVSAAPLLFDAFQRLAERRTPLAQAPTGSLKATGANLPPPLRRFNNVVESAELATSAFRVTPLKIAFPPDRSVVEAEASDGVTIKAEGGTLPLTWMVDGAPVAANNHQRQLLLPGVARGFLKISVIDASGNAERIVIRVR